MNIHFDNYFSNNNVISIEESLLNPLIDRNKEIAILVTIAFGYLGLCYLINRYYFKDKQVNIQANDLDFQKKDVFSNKQSEDLKKVDYKNEFINQNMDNPIDFSEQILDIKDINMYYKSEKEKFHYTDNPPPSLNLFDLQKNITLQKDTLKICVNMSDDGRVEEVANNPVYLYTDYLGPCIAAIGKCKISNSSMLIGVTHIFPDKHEYIFPSKTEHFDTEKIRIKSYKLDDLTNKFLSHPSYQDEKIELFFAGGNGSSHGAFWRELIIEQAKSIQQVNVIGTYFNPYEATQEIEDEIRAKKLGISFLAGITNEGSILLHKSHEINFKFQYKKSRE